jgi:transcriptional regulator with XRE-family HTH domain
MKSLADLPDDALLRELGRRLARRRIHVGLSQAGLGVRAGIAKRSVERLEAGQPTGLSTVLRALRALGSLGGIDGLVAPVAGPERRRVARARPPARPPRGGARR